MKKFFGDSKDRSIELITEVLGAYESAQISFKNINHVLVSLAKNNQWESNLS
ncbi:hypothetical protein [Fervidobacterium sp.]